MSRMEIVLLLLTLVQRFVLSVPQGLICFDRLPMHVSVPQGSKLPSGDLAGDAILVQPEQYSLALLRRTEV